MSQAGVITASGGSGPTAVETLTGNTGGAVGPTGNNINVVGTGSINVAGSPGTSTLTISSTVASTVYDADTGSATPSAGILNVNGTAAQGISTTGSGNTLVWTISNASAVQKGVASFNATEFTATAGVITSNPITVTGAGGITITGSPVNLGGTITITAGATIPTTFNGNTGSATPAANVLDILGNHVAAGIVPVSTSAATNVVTVNVQATQAIASTNVNNIGLAAFNSAQFTVDANGFVSITNFTPFAYTQINHASSPYTVLTTDYYISADPTAGVITILLPNAPTLYREFVIKDRTGTASANNISVSTVGGSVTIDGQTTYTLVSNFAAIQLLYNGTNYEIF